MTLSPAVVSTSGAAAVCTRPPAVHRCAQQATARPAESIPGAAVPIGPGGPTAAAAVAMSGGHRAHGPVPPAARFDPDH
ncbi:hypothetical protein ACFFHJ_11760 [Planotetraspora thailandica]|uniref:hypothetical protein n=1 Tax=Planotetraspora thailandica TaxID=487172 RepID=UPI0019506CCA|nr:hypothetical protein [Planotetraspora thailandica]